MQRETTSLALSREHIVMLKRLNRLIANDSGVPELCLTVTVCSGVGTYSKEILVWGLFTRWRQADYTTEKQQSVVFVGQEIEIILNWMVSLSWWPAGALLLIHSPLQWQKFGLYLCDNVWSCTDLAQFCRSYITSFELTAVFGRANSVCGIQTQTVIQMSKRRMEACVN